MSDGVLQTKYNGPALYIHIPFCQAKCRYCGFYSEPIEQHDVKALVAALLWWRRTGRGAFGLFLLACMVALAAWGMRFLMPPALDAPDQGQIEAYSRFVERLAIIRTLVHFAGVAFAGAGGVALLRRVRPQPADL